MDKFNKAYMDAANSMAKLGWFGVLLLPILLPAAALAVLPAAIGILLKRK